MGQRSLRESVIPFQLVQTGFLAFVIHEIEELLLTLRGASVGGDGNDKNKTSNRDNGLVHFQCTLYVRSCCFLRTDGWRGWPTPFPPTDQIKPACYARTDNDGESQEIPQHGDTHQANAQEAGHDDETSNPTADSDPVHGNAIV